jgi:hypothetical protein
MATGSTDENLQVLQEVISAFAGLNIAYALGGSWASSLHGQPRFTQDADISVDPFPGKEAALCARFGDDYYLSLPAIQQAVRQRSSFNIINTRLSFKVDIFVRKERPFERSVMARRQPVHLSDAADQPIMLVSPEDIILLKLEWYHLGNEASDRQWNDILGVLKVQAGRLDDAYLDRWAADLNVRDLLARARQESKV